MFYPGDGHAEKTSMRIEDVTFRDITATGHAYDGTFACDADSPCRGFVFRDVRLASTKGEWRCKAGTGDKCCAHAAGKVVDVQPEGLTDCLKHSA